MKYKMISLVFTGVLLIFALLLFLRPTLNSAQAATATGLTLNSLVDNSGDCGVTPYSPSVGLLFTGAVVGAVANTPDSVDGFGNPVDWFIVIIFDGNGNPIGGTRYGMALATYPSPLLSDMTAIPEISGFVAPQARPFTALVYDTDGDKTSVSAITPFPVMAVSAQFDPSSASAACAALPIGTFDGTFPSSNAEGRINQVGEPAAIFVSEAGGIQVYGIDADSHGYLAAYITAADLEDVVCPTEEEGNQLLAESADGKFAIYILTSCENQVNVGPFGEDGKVQVTIWTGIPATNIYHTEFFVYP